MRGRHTIDHNLFGTTGSGYYGTTRTHAEAIHTAPVHLSDKAILGCGQVFAASVLVMILYLVDEF